MESQVKSFHINSEPSRFIDYAYILFKARRWILGLSLGGAIFMIIMALILPKQYSSSVTFVSLAKATAQVAGGDRPDIGLLAALSMMGSGSGNNPLYLSILQSTRIRDLIIQNTRLNERLGMTNPKGPRGWLAKNTFFKESKGGVVEVRVTAPDPETAQIVAQEYIDQLNFILGKVTLTQAQKQVLFLENRIEELQKEMSQIKSEQAFRIKEMVYLGMMKEVEIARASAAKERIDVETLDFAEKPETHSFPNTRVFGLIGAVIGLFLGIVGCFFVAGFQSSRRDPYNSIKIKQMLTELKI